MLKNLTFLSLAADADSRSARSVMLMLIVFIFKKDPARYAQANKQNWGRLCLLPLRRNICVSAP